MTYYKTEALSWLLKSKNEQALNATSLQSTAEAIDAVRRLYAAGASRVVAVVTHTDPESGDSADMLEVTFPRERRVLVEAVVKSLGPDNSEGVEDAAEDNSPNPTWVLWWD